MAKLPDSFPGFAALDAAGEATHAKLRKRIADGTLKEIPGIAEATAEKIEEAFEKIDSPDVQGKEMLASEDDKTTPVDHAAKGAAHAAAGTKVNDGTVDAGTRAKAKEEGEKSGVQKNQEMDNHALDQPTGAEQDHNAAVATDGQRLALSGAVFVDDPSGSYVSKTAVHISQKDGRIKVLPISHVSPVKGMEVRDGEDVYALGEEFRRDSSPGDWLKVRSPNTGKPLID